MSGDGLAKAIDKITAAFTSTPSQFPHPSTLTHIHTMVKPLTFKGDKPKKRKHRADPYPDPSSRPKPSTSTTTTDTVSASASANDDDNAEDTSWVSADTPSDLAGPVLLVLSTDPPTCIATDANGTVFASAIENLVDGDAATAEPHDVRQVWVATRVAGTEAVSFKGHHGKCVYLFQFSLWEFCILFLW